MGEVLPLVSESAVDRAWNAYHAHAGRSVSNRTLLIDRPYMEEWARLERNFKRLCLALDDA